MQSSIFLMKSLNPVPPRTRRLKQASSLLHLQVRLQKRDNGWSDLCVRPTLVNLELVSTMARISESGPRRISEINFRRFFDSSCQRWSPYAETTFVLVVGKQSSNSIFSRSLNFLFPLSSKCIYRPSPRCTKHYYLLSIFLPVFFVA